MASQGGSIPGSLVFTPVRKPGPWAFSNGWAVPIVVSPAVPWGGERVGEQTADRRTQALSYDLLVKATG